MLSRRVARRLPIFKLLAVAEIALMARKHLQHLDPAERRRLGELVRRGRSLSPAERTELRALTSKLEPRVFAGAALDQLSSIPLPRSLSGRR